MAVLLADDALLRSEQEYNIAVLFYSALVSNGLWMTQDCGCTQPASGDVVHYECTSYLSVPRKKACRLFDKKVPLVCTVSQCGGSGVLWTTSSNQSMSSLTPDQETNNPVAVYTCAVQNTNIVVTAVRTCTATGIGDLFICHESDCGSPPPPMKGASVDFTSTSYGSTATYTCEQEFDLTGTPEIVCQHVWTTRQFTCTEKCYDPDDTSGESYDGYISVGYTSRITVVVRLIIHAPGASTPREQIRSGISVTFHIVSRCDAVDDVNDDYETRFNTRNKNLKILSNKNALNLHLS
ncbi:hypothetical protein ScPMuIL_015430 [Solemya velum]